MTWEVVDVVVWDIAEGARAKSGISKMRRVILALAELSDHGLGPTRPGEPRRSYCTTLGYLTAEEADDLRNTF